MRKHCATFIIFIIIVIVAATPALAHSGKTDGAGGHYNHSTGEYHYHHGYPEHQHPNGICPYNFDDQTDHGSGSAGNTSVPKINKPSTTKYTGHYDAGNSNLNDGGGWFANLPAVLQLLISLSIIFLPFLLSLLYGLCVRCKEWFLYIKFSKKK